MTEYIRRNDAVKIAEKYGLANGSILGRHSGVAECIASEISALPAANVTEEVYGCWEWFDEETGTPIDGYEREWGWRCSHCNTELSDDYDDPDIRPEMKYCDNCGAKMEQYNEPEN